MAPKKKAPKRDKKEGSVDGVARHPNFTKDTEKQPESTQPPPPESPRRTK